MRGSPWNPGFYLKRGSRIPQGRAGLRFHLLAQALFGFAKFGREFGAEVFGREHLADFDFCFALRGQGAAFDPFDRFLFRRDLQHPEAGHQFLGFRKWPVDDGALAAGEPDASAFGTGVQPLARQHDAGLDQRFVELAHVGQQLFAGHFAGFAVFVGFDQNHEFHFGLLEVGSGEPGQPGQKHPALTGTTNGWSEIDSGRPSFFQVFCNSA
jgi:hypothetical protein